MNCFVDGLREPPLPVVMILCELFLFANIAESVWLGSNQLRRFRRWTSYIALEIKKVYVNEHMFNTDLANIGKITLWEFFDVKFETDHWFDSRILLYWISIG